MPWEVTDKFIRSGHRDPSDFEPESLRTIWISEEEGIRAIIGKPKGKDATEVVSYLFALEKDWNLEKAKVWFKEHHQEKSHEHLYCLTPILEKIVEKPLKIRGVAMTAGMSRNLNVYMEDELERFASKLVSSPVYLEHVSSLDAVGRVTSAVWDPDSKMLFYEAEIYDDETQEKIRKGLIRHVSVAADYERIDVLNGRAPHGLHNAELSLVAVPGIPQTNIQVMEKLTRNPGRLEASTAKRIEERIWTRRYVNDLPDSAFAVILPGGEKDETDKTTPRSLRKFPHHDRSGAVDLPHLRNANARVPQSEIPEEYKRGAMRHLAAHKRQAGVGIAAEEAKLLEQEDAPEEIGLEIAPEPSMDELIASIEEIVDQINEALEELTSRVQALEEQGGVEEAKGGRSAGRAVVAPEALEGQKEPFDFSKVRLRDVMKHLS